MKPKALVIDDEESIRYTFEAFLTRGGYEVRAAASFDEGIVALEKFNPEVVFVDIVLGGKTGIELLDAIKKRNINCPVVVMTGSPSIDTASRAVQLGAFDYITKPIEDNTLMKVAAMAVEKQRLIEEKERYRASIESMFSSVGEGIALVGTDYILKEANPMFFEIYGIDMSAIGVDMRNSPGFCDQCIELLHRALEGRTHVHRERTVCHLPDGITKPVSVLCSPVTTSFGKLLGAMLVVRDDTRVERLEQMLKARSGFHNIIGGSKAMLELYGMIDTLADLDTTVLVTGESGTGKELIAEALHARGSRASKPFVAVNCGALPDTLIESELFGHVRGAFTGAVTDRMGRFEAANTGTIFLDEIGEVSPAVQVRLLRVLQEKHVERLGEQRSRTVDLRIIAATNRDLHALIKQGRFREDLYYRLKVVELRVPPLRERKDDIAALAEHFVGKCAERLKKPGLGISEEAIDALVRFSWPGNVRQLEHAIEYSSIRCHGKLINVADLPQEVMVLSDDTPEERNNIIEELKNAGGNKAKAARALGISRKTLYDKIRRYNIPDSE